MERDELTRYLDELLEPARFKDYCPNGLQVEGRAKIRRVVAGVTASQALVDRAVAEEADALLVHHGWFWRGEDGRVTGVRKIRDPRPVADYLRLQKRFAHLFRAGHEDPRVARLQAMCDANIEEYGLVDDETTG